MYIVNFKVFPLDHSDSHPFPPESPIHFNINGVMPIKAQVTLGQVVRVGGLLVPLASCEDTAIQDQGSI